MQTIVIGCDNAAVNLKNEIIKFLKNNGISYEDVGVFIENDEELYPNIAEKVSSEIIKSGYTKKGILVCGTGIGMAIAANKFKGIYAAVCHDVYSMERAVLSNNANVITMGARVVAPQLAIALLKIWLQYEFKDGSSTSKINRIKDFENINFK